uniref:Uncharacterized protein n=1 Tax=Neospora caninum (strain Liverpool) TaxID=572307 RepID=A0A0F7U8E6_NEOCL|nr:TPA: hypothetical protein BN1204_019750 [Neospora caninum Liverpool]
MQPCSVSTASATSSLPLPDERGDTERAENRPENEETDESGCLIGFPRKCSAKATWLFSTLIGLFFLFFLYRRHRLTFEWPYEKQQISAYSEGSFYYSFFNDVIAAPTWRAGLDAVLRDERSEHPDVVNALRRFNVYQELLAGLLYRALHALLGDAWLTEYIARTPFNFYTACVFLLQALGVAVLVGLAAVTGGSAFCACACFGFFFANYYHRLVVRVQATPLRENWALPFLWINIATVVVLLQTHARIQRVMLRRWATRKDSAKPSASAVPCRDAKCHAALRQREKKLLALLFLSTLLLLVLWQFGVFVITTQVAALFATLLVGFPVERLMRRVFAVLCAAFVANVFLHFFPRYLLLSFLPHTLFSVVFVLLAWPISRLRTARQKESSGGAGGAALRLFPQNVQRGFLAVVLCLLIRLSLGGFDKDDSHVFQLLLYKLGLAPHTFDTNIYLMGGTEFEFFSPYFFNLIAPSRLFLCAGVALFLFLLLASDQLLFLHHLGRLSPRLYVNLSEETLTVDGGEEKMEEDNEETARQKAVETSDPPRTTDSRYQHTRRFPSSAGAPELRRRRPGKMDKQDEAPRSAVDAVVSVAEKRRRVEGKLRAQLEDQLVSSVYLMPDLFYLSVQTVFFVVLMLLIARLRVLCLPLLCVLAAVTVASPALWRALACALAASLNLPTVASLGSRLTGGLRCRSRVAFLVHALLFTCAAALPFCLKLPVEEMIGVDPATENAANPSRLSLIDWLKTNLPPDAAIIGDMPASATLRAATKLRLVIHPQFEQTEMRKRVQFLYGASACPPEKLYAAMMQRVYKTDYLLISNFRCAAPKEKKISVFSVADLVEEKSFTCPKAVASLARFCFKSQLSSSAFDLVYRNGMYAVLKVKGAQEAEQPKKKGQRDAAEEAGGERTAQRDRREEERELKETLRSLDVQTKNEAYLSFDWKTKLSTLETFDPWIKRCIRDDERCGRSMQEFAQELADMYGLQLTSRLLQEKAISLFPSDSDVLFGHGVFLDFDMNNRNDATAYYERGADKDPLSVAKTVQFLLFLDQAIGRSRAVADVDRLLRLERVLEEKTNQQLLDDAASLCKAALLLKQLVDTQVEAGAMRDTPNVIREEMRVMRRLWEKSKELNIQNECVVEAWAYFEKTRLTLARRIQHFFLGESVFLSRLVHALALAARVLSLF